MLPGPDEIRACPTCLQRFRRFTLRSGNTFGATRWTNGHVDAPMMPELPSLVRCPHCQSRIWVDDAELLDKADELDLTGTDLTPQYLEVSAEDFLDALEETPATDSERVRFLRIRAWWSSGTRSDRGKANMGQLFNELNEVVPHERLMKAELARELGRFAEAEALLSFAFPDEFCHAVAVIRRLTEQRATKVAQIHGHEGFTPEEIAERRAEAARRRAAVEAKRRELLARAPQIRMRERAAWAERVRRGELCPRCGFSYRWDGKTCGHCRYGKD